MIAIAIGDRKATIKIAIGDIFLIEIVIEIAIAISSLIKIEIEIAIAIFRSGSCLAYFTPFQKHLKNYYETKNDENLRQGSNL